MACWIFMKVGTVFTKSHRRSASFVKIKLSDKHNLLKGVNEFLSLLPTHVDWFAFTSVLSISHNADQRMCVPWKSVQWKPWLIEGMKKCCPYFLQFSFDSVKIRYRRCSLESEWMWVQLKSARFTHRRHELLFLPSTFIARFGRK